MRTKSKKTKNEDNSRISTRIPSRFQLYGLDRLFYKRVKKVYRGTAKPNVALRFDDETKAITFEIQSELDEVPVYIR